MPDIARVGDIVGGGAIIDGALTVTAGGMPVATQGSIVAPHGIGPHAAPVLISGSLTVLAMGRPIARLGDIASCGDAIAVGLPTVQVGA